RSCPMLARSPASPPFPYTTLFRSLGLSAYEWTAIVFAIGLVLVSEIWNTAIEHMADFMTQECNPRIKRIKDLGAAGVLLSALFAVAVGLIVFLPKLSALLFP